MENEAERQKFEKLIANLRTVPGGVFSRGHSHDDRLPIGTWCKEAADALELAARASESSPPQHTHEPTMAIVKGCPACEAFKRRWDANVAAATAPSASTATPRKIAEQLYVETAFDYERDPIGSRDWCNFWSGFQCGRSRAVVAPTATDWITFEQTQCPECNHRFTVAVRLGTQGGNL